jgi:hypothetical protein
LKLRLSQSEIELFKADQWAWYFSNYEGYTLPGGDIGTALSVGSAVHEGLEGYYKGEQPRQKINDYYRSLEIPPHKVQVAQDERELAEKLVERYINHYSPADDLRDLGTVVGVEDKLELFQADYGFEIYGDTEVYLIGKCDLITDRGIVDHKTAKVIYKDFKSSYYPRHQGRHYLWLLSQISGEWRGEFIYNIICKTLPSNRTKPDKVYFHRESLYYSRAELKGFAKSLDITVRQIVDAVNKLNDGYDFRTILYPTHDPTSYRTNIFQEHYPMLWETMDDQRWRAVFDEQYVKHNPLERYEDGNEE